MRIIKQFLQFFFIFTFALAIVACGGGGGGSTSSITPSPTPTPTPAPTPPPAGNPAFIEVGGVVIAELESISIDGTDWNLVNDAAATGGQAIEWMGADLFNAPGQGIIEVNVQISTPGTYLFTWLNKVGEGTSATEANDSWLRIESDRFYGVRASDGRIVCPKGLNASENSCTGEEPEGSGSGGWFKAYRFGGPVGDYHWRVATSDNDPHEIFVDFLQAGTYSIQISGRSAHHVIDRLALVLNSLDPDTASVMPESERVGN